MPPSAIRPNGPECRQARILAGLGVRQAADAVGCSHAHISNIELGKVGAGPALMKRMADTYAVPMERLFTFVEAEGDAA